MPLVAGRERSCPLVGSWPGQSAVHRRKLVLQRNLLLLVAEAARFSGLEGSCAYWACSRAVEGSSRYQGAFVELCLILTFERSCLLLRFFHRLRHCNIFSPTLEQVSKTASPLLFAALTDDDSRICTNQTFPTARSWLHACARPARALCTAGRHCIHGETPHCRFSAQPWLVARQCFVITL